ncbi:MAG: chromosome partitioning protein ParB [Hyphomicrobiales bacterium]|jgi:ParB family chromosome partitioning protein|nr:chromosome partitioning protein ParB [Hyphomicrobiales bacterium]
MADEHRPRLGRGLAALIGDSAPEQVAASATSPRRIPIEFIKPNPRNPRRTFNDEQLGELADSIKEKGVIQPILVRAIDGLADAFEIIAGERRWRAAQRVGIHDVPVLVIEADDKQSLEIAIIENVQRSDLNPIDEAYGYEKLAKDFGYSQADLAKIIGKSRSHIANTLRLMKLPKPTLELVEAGVLSAGHARALLSVADPEGVARKIVAEGLTVRDVERLGQDEARKVDEKLEVKSVKQRAQKDADTRALEKALNDVLGMNVAIKHKGEAGEVAIRYTSLEQLDALCQRLKA